MDLFLTDLKNKEVINIHNGKRLGYVCDVELDIKDARLLSIILPGEGGGIFSKSEPISIPWTCIQHIGEDLIIVNMKGFPVNEEKKKI